MSEPLLENQYLRLKKCRDGYMLYNVHDTIVGRSLDLYGEYAEQELSVLRQVVKPSQVVLDIGANIGAHTVLLGQLVGPSGVVLAFEPQRIIFQMLCANVALNALTNVDCRLAAVGEAPGALVVPMLNLQAENNFGSLGLGTWTEGERVPVQTVDDLGLQECHFIKVDVEGMELEALKGAAHTIARHRPVLYVENDRREQSPALMQFLLQMGYRLYWHRPFFFSPANVFGNSHNVFGGLVTQNLLCIPEHWKTELSGFAAVQSPTEWPE